MYIYTHTHIHTHMHTYTHACRSTTAYQRLWQQATRRSAFLQASSSKSCMHDVMCQHTHPHTHVCMYVCQDACAHVLCPISCTIRATAPHVFVHAPEEKNKFLPGKKTKVCHAFNENEDALKPHLSLAFLLFSTHPGPRIIRVHGTLNHVCVFGFQHSLVHVLYAYMGSQKHTHMTQRRRMYVCLR